MDADEVVWPTGMSDQDPAARARPLVFNPRGFLVAILEDADQAERAKVALAEAGFADTDLRVYTSEQILDSWERFQAERSLAQRVAGAVTDDPETIERTSATPARAAPPCGCTSPTTPTPIEPSAAWPTTRSSTSATTATTASTTCTSAEASSTDWRREGCHEHHR